MKSKRVIFLLIFAIVLQHVFAHDEPQANIRIKLENEEIIKINIPKPNDVSVPVNNDLCEALNSLDKKIKAAKEISVSEAEKACIDEGVYEIEYLQEGKKYEVQNDCWIYESVSEKFYRCHVLNELRILKEIHEQSDFYDEYFIKNSLTSSDCENLEFIKWLFKYESGIEISGKKIELIKTDYSGGVPIQITQLPYYYKVSITNSEYKQFKKILKKNEDWKIYKDGKISLRLITKFRCSCVIEKDGLIFGFGNIDTIHP